jgi:cell division septum initiation protein DivIVA
MTDNELLKNIYREMLEMKSEIKELKKEIKELKKEQKQTTNTMKGSIFF